MTHVGSIMSYVILCYRDERVIDAASRVREKRVADDLAQIVDGHIANGTMTTSVTLLATTTSTTLRLLRGMPLVLDGPAFEMGGQLQSLHLVTCAGLEEALAVAGAMARVEPGGIYEVRPIAALAGRTASEDAHERA